MIVPRNFRGVSTWSQEIGELNAIRCVVEGEGKAASALPLLSRWQDILAFWWQTSFNKQVLALTSPCLAKTRCSVSSVPDLMTEASRLTPFGRSQLILFGSQAWFHSAEGDVDRNGASTYPRATASKMWEYWLQRWVQRGWSSFGSWPQVHGRLKRSF